MVFYAVNQCGYIRVINERETAALNWLVGWFVKLCLTPSCLRKDPRRRRKREAIPKVVYIIPIPNLYKVVYIIPIPNASLASPECLLH